MSKPYLWAQPLAVQQTDLDSWSKMVGPSDSLIAWCIKNQKINPDDYLQWARNYYGIPSLTSNFFTTSYNEAFFKSVESMSFWSKDLLPIGEWDGVLFLACVEPQESTPWSFPVQFLLASPTDIEATWLRLTQPSAVEAPALPEMPAGLNFDAQPLAPVAETPKESTPVVPIEMPEGLASTFSFKLNIPSEDPPSLPFPIEPITRPKETPLALHPVVTPQGLANSPTAIQTEDVPLPPFTPPSVMNLNSPSNQKSTPASSLENSTFKDFFVRLTGAFTHMQVLEWVESPDNKAGKLKVIASHGNWSPTESSVQMPIHLEEPSIFRIAVRTRLPYHGYVVPSETNEKFFQSWGLVGWPEHVTLVPIKENKKVFGVLLCLGAKSANTPEALHMVEETAQQLQFYFANKAKHVA